MFSQRKSRFVSLLQRATSQRSMLFSYMIVGALVAFEVFNYSTTEFAMSDLLGDLRFAGLRWSTILAFAFCGIDFAGIARIFTPEQGDDEPAEVWYLFSAWLLAASMNAILTWWGVSIAILQHQSLGNAVISREVLLNTVPIFMALMVWLSRVLIIGTFSIAGEHLFMQAGEQPVRSYSSRPAASARRVVNPRPARTTYKPQPTYGTSYRPAPKPQADPSYQPAPMAAQSTNNTEQRNLL